NSIDDCAKMTWDLLSRNHLETERFAMDEISQRLTRAIEEKKQTVLDAERYIWKHPEAGYKEWKTHAYLKEQFEKLGYTVTELGNIPGFYADVETGRPGPRIAVFGELDALIIPGHPESDPETGCVHACGHNCQTAGLLGVAIALKAPGALDGLSGSVRLIAVPAEECIDTDFREDLRAKGIIHYLGGKLELIYRGVLNDVDMAMMVHATSKHVFSCEDGSNGFIVKKATFVGLSAHAGGSPHKGHNALYAATCAINAANALRETFRDADHIRFHPIITAGGSVVNAIPDHVVVDSYIRGATMEAILNANEKINRAFAGAAASMGCRVILEDQHGYAPRYNDPGLMEVFREAGSLFLDPDKIEMGGWGAGSSDMGDVSTLMPAVHPNIGGVIGSGHGTDYFVNDPEMATVTSAKIQVCALAALLRDGASRALKILADKKVTYASREEYLAAVDSLTARYDAVQYGDDGSVKLKFIG
ncbi:MAG: amidohydrolase, partial [Clostridia bacterium]|nr:amidohydrolase [Clostridia bacterium]